jgi:hypothetical protein
VFYRVLGQNGLKNKFFDLKNPSPNFLVTIVAGIWTKQKTCHLFFFISKNFKTNDMSVASLQTKQTKDPTMQALTKMSQVGLPNMLSPTTLSLYFFFSNVFLINDYFMVFSLFFNLYLN